MNITDMTYHNTDQEYYEICDFLNGLSAKDPCKLWDSGWMNGWRHELHVDKDPQFFQDNVHVWRTEHQEIVGLCISEYGRNDMFIEVLPEYRGIYPDMFRWLETTWAATRSAIEIVLYCDDTHKIDRLNAQGYAFKAHRENKRIYELEQRALDYTLEEGFTIQAFSESFDFAGRVALVQSAFDNPRYTEARVKGMIASPDYIDDYNLAVISPEKQQVAYCVGWPDRANERGGYIEPVGTHAAYRRRGFAKAVIQECFRRMKANGIHTVTIASGPEPKVSNYLYESLSPQSKREVHIYAKEVVIHGNK